MHPDPCPANLWTCLHPTTGRATGWDLDSRARVTLGGQMGGPLLILSSNDVEALGPWSLDPDAEWLSREDDDCAERLIPAHPHSNFEATFEFCCGALLLEDYTLMMDFNGLALDGIEADLWLPMFMPPPSPYDEEWFIFHSPYNFYEIGEILEGHLSTIYPHFSERLADLHAHFEDEIPYLDAFWASQVAKTTAREADHPPRVF